MNTNLTVCISDDEPHASGGVDEPDKFRKSAEMEVVNSNVCIPHKQSLTSSATDNDRKSAAQKAKLNSGIRRGELHTSSGIDVADNAPSIADTEASVKSVAHQDQRHSSGVDDNSAKMEVIGIMYIPVDQALGIDRIGTERPRKHTEPVKSLIVAASDENNCPPKRLTPYKSYLSQINSQPVDLQVTFRQFEEKKKKAVPITLSDSDEDVEMWVEKPVVVDLLSSDDDESSSRNNRAAQPASTVKCETKLEPALKTEAKSSLEVANNRKLDNNVGYVNNQRETVSPRRGDPTVNNITTEVNKKAERETSGAVSPDSNKISTPPDHTGASASRTVAPSDPNDVSSNWSPASPDNAAHHSNYPTPNSSRHGLKRAYDASESKNSPENDVTDKNENRIASLHGHPAPSKRFSMGRKKRSSRYSRATFPEGNRAVDASDSIDGSKEKDVENYERDGESFCSKRDKKTSDKHRHNRHRPNDTYDDSMHSRNQSHSPADSRCSTSSHKRKSGTMEIGSTSDQCRAMHSRNQSHSPADSRRSTSSHKRKSGTMEIGSTSDQCRDATVNWSDDVNIEKADQKRKRQDSDKRKTPVSSSISNTNDSTYSAEKPRLTPSSSIGDNDSTACGDNPATISATSPVVGNDSTVSSEETRIFVSKSKVRLLIATDKGYHFLNSAFGKHRVKIRMEWEPYENVLVIVGTNPDKVRFMDDLTEFLEGTRGINGFEDHLPRHREPMIRKIEEYLDVLKRPLGDVEKLFCIMNANENSHTRQGMKAANRVRKDLNIILLGQAGLRDGRMHLAGLKRNFQTVLDQGYNTIPKEIHEAIEQHFNYIFSSRRHSDYRALIREYKILNEPHYYPASSSGPSFENTRMLLLKPVQYSEAMSSSNDAVSPRK